MVGVGITLKEKLASSKGRWLPSLRPPSASLCQEARGDEQPSDPVSARSTRELEQFLWLRLPHVGLPGWGERRRGPTQPLAAGGVGGAPVALCCGP